MNRNIDAQMTKKGYEKVQGMAILNDVAVTETHREILSPTLSTQKSVDVFNNEFCDGWTLYRKVSPTPECKHGARLYGVRCINCDRKFKNDGVVNSEGQLKVGDKITIFGKSTLDDQITTVKDVIKVDGNEEIIINKTKNKYFITKMLIKGESWAKKVQVSV